jgi:hypothetical protein
MSFHKCTVSAKSYSNDNTNEILHLRNMQYINIWCYRISPQFTADRTPQTDRCAECITVRSCYATQKMQTCSANTSASRKTKQSLESVQRTASPASQRRLFLHRCLNCKGYCLLEFNVHIRRNASDRETVAACNIICSLYN